MINDADQRSENLVDYALMKSNSFSKVEPNSAFPSNLKGCGKLEAKKKYK